LEAVTKILADMICGPAIIVVARGRIPWFIASPCLVAGVAGPGLEGGQVADLRLYARSGCSILLYRGGRITEMGYL
jgi:hypothetical protein